MRGRLENDCTENYANGKVWLKKLVGSFRFYSIIIRVFRLPKGTPQKKKKKKKKKKKFLLHVVFRWELGVVSSHRSGSEAHWHLTLNRRRASVCVPPSVRPFHGVLHGVVEPSFLLSCGQEPDPTHSVYTSVAPYPAKHTHQQRACRTAKEIQAGSIVRRPPFAARTQQWWMAEAEAACGLTTPDRSGLIIFWFFFLSAFVYDRPTTFGAELLGWPTNLLLSRMVHFSRVILEW